MYARHAHAIFKRGEVDELTKITVARRFEGDTMEEIEAMGARQVRMTRR